MMFKKLFATLLLCVVLLLSGCSGGSSPAPSDSDTIPQEDLTYIKEHVEEALVGFNIGNVSVLNQQGKVTVSVKMKYGIWGDDFPACCEISSSSALEAVAEKEVELGDLTVLVSAKSGAMLSWHSTDGISGVLADNRDGENHIYADVAVGDFPGFGKEIAPSEAETLGFTMDELSVELDEKSEREFASVSPGSAPEIAILQDTMQHCELHCYSSGDEVEVVLVTTSGANGTVRGTWKSTYLIVEKLAGENCAVEEYEAKGRMVYAIFAPGSSIDHLSLDFIEGKMNE